MKNIFPLLVLTMIMGSCAQKDFSNQDSYELKVGEEFELYYSTNSCCYYCCNFGELECVEKTGDKVVDPYPDDCDGCNQTEAFVFKAHKVGVDTIYLAKIEGGEDCLIDKSSAQKYVVTVK